LKRREKRIDGDGDRRNFFTNFYLRMVSKANWCKWGKKEEYLFSQ